MKCFFLGIWGRGYELITGGWGGDSAYEMGGDARRLA